MTLNVAIGLAAANTSPRSGEWSKGAGAEADGRGFDEALAGGAGKRKPADAGGQTVEPAWKGGAYRAKIGLNSADAGVNAGLAGVEVDPEIEFEAGIATFVEGTFGLEPEQPTIEEVSASVPGEPEQEHDMALPSQEASPGIADSAIAVLQALVGDGPVSTTTAEVAAVMDEKATNLDAPPAMEEATEEDPRQATRNASADARGASTNAAAPAAAAAVAVAEQTVARTAERRAARPQAQQGRADLATNRSGGPPEDLPQQRTVEPAVPAPREPIQQGMARPPQDAGRLAGIAEDIRMPSGDARAPAPDALAARVNVLGFSSAPAPAPHLPGVTAAGLVAAIEGDATWRQAAVEAALAGGPRNPTSLSGVNTLRIQLNPAELGMVTARLTAVGSQLSIEIQVETSDARQRLASDSDAILKALRAIGYDVDKVTIQQASQNGQPGAQSGAGGGRDQFQADQQARENGGAKDQGARNGTGGGNGEARGHGSGEAAGERPGGGVYI